MIPFIGLGGGTGVGSTGQEAGSGVQSRNRLEGAEELAALMGAPFPFSQLLVEASGEAAARTDSAVAGSGSSPHPAYAPAAPNAPAVASVAGDAAPSGAAAAFAATAEAPSAPPVQAVGPEGEAVRPASAPGSAGVESAAMRSEPGAAAVADVETAVLTGRSDGDAVRQGPYRPAPPQARQSGSAAAGRNGATAAVAEADPRPVAAAGAAPAATAADAESGGATMTSGLRRLGANAYAEAVATTRMEGGARRQDAPAEPQPVQAPTMAEMGSQAGIPAPEISVANDAAASAETRGGTGEKTASEGVRSQVAARLVNSGELRDGAGELRLQLDPRELGRVEVSFIRDGDNLQVTIRAETAAAARALSEGAAELGEIIVARGGHWQAAQVTVSCEEGDDSAGGDGGSADRDDPGSDRGDGQDASGRNGRGGEQGDQA